MLIRLLFLLVFSEVLVEAVVVGAGSNKESVEPSSISARQLADGWDLILQRFIDPKSGRVDYQGIWAARAELQSHIDRYAEAKPQSWSENERKATLINLYNAAMIQAVVKYLEDSNLTPDSPEFLKIEINKIKNSGGNIWNGSFKVRLAGIPFTLDHIEHGLIRGQMKAAHPRLAIDVIDPRIHAAVNCAALSCPRIREVAYRAENIDQMLNDSMHEFVNSEKQFYKLDEDSLAANSIVLWYYSDFDKMGKGAGEYLASFLNPESPKFIREHLNTKFNKRSTITLRLGSAFNFHYDWHINDRRQP